MKSDTLLLQYAAARHRSTFTARVEMAWIVVSGRDRATYLQGLLTNDVVALKPGEGCYAAYLTPQGRMIADLCVYELGDLMLLALAAGTRQTVLAKLEQFIFSEDVQLGDVSETFVGHSVIGPTASRAVAQVLGIDAGTIQGLPLHGNKRASFEGAPCILLRVADRGEDAFDLLVEVGKGEALAAALAAAGVTPVDAALAETLRIEGGVARFHHDMDEEIIPLEAGIESRAISFNKGCYVGQEVIIRVLHRGHGRVAKKLVGLTLTGDAVPPAGAVIERDGKAVGKVTSATWSPMVQQAIALGYVHRDSTEPGTRVQIGGREATVVVLPFHQ